MNVPVSGIAADSLGATQVGGLMWQIAKDRISQAILVSDDLIRQTQRLLWDELRVVAEPGGATALAAIVGGLYCRFSDDCVRPRSPISYWRP